MNVVQTKSEIKDDIREKIKQISSANNEPKCILDHRLSMWEAYESEPTPSQVNHRWRYSNPSWFELDTLLISTDSQNLQFNLSKECKDKGVIFTNIADIFKFEHLRETIKNNFGQLVKKSQEKLILLNEATWSNGYFLYVPKNVIIENPISVKTSFNLQAKLSSFKVLIILEDESHINLIDELSSSQLSSDLLTNVVIEIYLGKRAKLNYLNLQTQNKNTTQYLYQTSYLKDHAELNNSIVVLGGKTTKSDLNVELAGQSSAVTIHGIVVGEETQKFDHHSTITHLEPNTKSVLNFRVALKDKARSAFTGNLKINHEAAKSDAYQENRNLLLSNNARADSIPELEILTNDVTRCSHGVTVGNVDKDQIYYLTSRGINEKDAERLIIEGFLEPTISKIPDESQKEEILLKVKNKLEGL